MFNEARYIVVLSLFFYSETALSEVINLACEDKINGMTHNYAVDTINKTVTESVSGHVMMAIINNNEILFAENHGNEVFNIYINRTTGNMMVSTPSMPHRPEEPIFCGKARPRF